MIPWLGEDPTSPFPPAHQALHRPNGLLAAGGDLSVERLLNAYRRGIFPWFSEGQPLLWWSPDPRSVLFCREVHVARRLRRRIRSDPWNVTMDKAFADVVDGCAAPRRGQPETWITDRMGQAYRRLHAEGHAHSVEVWWDGELSGGLYGVAIGRMFFGESMFHVRPDASKIALVALCHQLSSWRMPLLDCQVHSTHLAGMGARLIPRHEFEDYLALTNDPGPRRWRFEFSLDELG